MQCGLCMRPDRKAGAGGRVVSAVCRHQLGGRAQDREEARQALQQPTGLRVPAGEPHADDSVNRRAPCGQGLVEVRMSSSPSVLDSTLV